MRPAVAGMRTSLWADTPVPRDGITRPLRLEPKQRFAKMLKSARSKAEEQFAATRKKDKQALAEREKERQKTAEHVAKLRALRLAKEAADKQAGENAAAKKATAGTRADRG